MRKYLGDDHAAVNRRVAYDGFDRMEDLVFLCQRRELAQMIDAADQCSYKLLLLCTQKETLLMLEDEREREAKNI